MEEILDKDGFEDVKFELALRASYSYCGVVA